MISNLTRRISLLWRRFTPLEEFLLDVLQQQLPEEPRGINQLRIDRINHVSRPLDWTEIMFYQMRNGRPVIGEEPMFPCRSNQSIILAEIRFSPEHTTKLWTSKIIAVRGHMFSIVTRPSPKPISFSGPFILKSVKLVDDAMLALPPTLLQRFHKCLPQDFHELEGQSLSGWSILRLSQLYDVALDDGDYLLLAERNSDTAFLAVRADGKSTNVYFLSHDAESHKAGSTLREAIENES